MSCPNTKEGVFDNSIERQTEYISKNYISRDAKIPVLAKFSTRFETIN